VLALLSEGFSSFREIVSYNFLEICRGLFRRPCRGERIFVLTFPGMLSPANVRQPSGLWEGGLERIKKVIAAKERREHKREADLCDLCVLLRPLVGYFFKGSKAQLQNLASTF
jgi:hypothetical protein